MYSTETKYHKHYH